MKNIFNTILTFLLALVASHTQAQIINTFAGGGGAACDTAALAIDAGFGFVISVATDNLGNVYTLDDACGVRKINSSGIISATIGGGGLFGYGGDGGPATLAKFHQPTGLAVDHNGNIYIADNLNYRIRKVNTSGIITTIAGTGISGYNGDNIPATSAQLYAPFDVAVDSLGNVYIADFSDFRVRKVDTTGIITTIAEMESPITGIAVDGSGNVYFSSGNNQTVFGEINNRVFKINTSSVITTIAGQSDSGYNGDNGPATAALLLYPYKITPDNKGNLFIADMGNNRIRKVDASGIITTYAGKGIAGFNGDGGLADSAELYGPTGIAVDGSGNLYIADQGNERVRYTSMPDLVPNINPNIPAITVYPNPNAGKFTLLISSTMQEQAKIIITNLMGEKVKEITTVTNKPEEVAIDALSGIYFVEVATTNGVCNKEVVVNK